MGAIRVRAHLTNAGDEALLRRGMRTEETVRSYETDALVDDGVVRTIVPAGVASQLGLTTVGRHVVERDGLMQTVDVAEPLAIELLGRSTVEDVLVLGDEVRIGRTVLAKLDLFIDSERGRVVPNPKHPDQAVNRV